MVTVCIYLPKKIHTLSLQVLIIFIPYVSYKCWYPWVVVQRKLIGFEVSLQCSPPLLFHYEHRQQKGNSTMSLKPILMETTVFRLASSLITNINHVAKQLVVYMFGQETWPDANSTALLATAIKLNIRLHVMQNGNWNQGMDSSELYSCPFVFKVTQTCITYYYYWWGGTESLGICSSS
jgi:hypothetical protein